MRGILVQFLVSRGIPFDAALETATQVRDRIAQQSEVTREDLRKLVDEVVGDRFDLDHPPLRSHERDTPLVRDSRGAAVPFSKGMLAVSLQGAGMEPADAYDVARELEARLLRQKVPEIDRTALRELVADTIERKHGTRAADRYRVWRRTVEDARPIFLLVGGSTGVGKTSISVEVARRLEISRVIGTDSIRQIMRLMFSKDLMPEIHCSTYEVYRVLPSLGAAPDPVIAGLREQAQKIVVGVHALLDRAVEEHTSMLIEGVNLVPGMIDLDRYRDSAHVISLVVANMDREAYRGRFTARERVARAREAGRYLEHFDEIAAIQDYILAQADHYELPIIDCAQFDEAVLSVTRSVIAKIGKSVPVAAELLGRTEEHEGVSG
jgi:2-phosphoglycerate kinase